MSKLAGIVQRQLKHDAPYAWFLRDQASTSPIFRSQHLAELDNRLEAYLNCFELSQNGDQPIIAKLNLKDWGSVYVIALVSLRTNDSITFDKAIDALKEQQQAKELSDALCRVDFNTAKPYLCKLIKHENPLARIAAITASGFFTKDIDKAVLQGLLKDSPEVIVATLDVIGKNKLINFKPDVTELLTHDEENVRFQAAYTGNLLGLTSAFSPLQKFCFNETPHLRKALSLLYQVVNESEIKPALNKIQKSAFSPRIKAYNIAMSGLPEMIPILLEWMNDPEYAPLAGEAFSFITGADIEEDDLSILDVSLCESQEAPLAEKRKKDPWTEGYEDDLPWPEPELVKQWWRAHQHQFQNGTRYLAGKTLTEAHLNDVLIHGTQPQRHIASLILTIKNPLDTMIDVTRFNQL